VSCIQNADPQKANCLFFFEIASTGIPEVTWRRAPIHTKIGTFSWCDFYSRYRPSLGIATAAKQKYSPLGHWDVSLQQRKKPPRTQRVITSSHQAIQVRDWDHSSQTLSEAAKAVPSQRDRAPKPFQSCLSLAQLSPLDQTPAPLHVPAQRGTLLSWCWHPQHPGQDLKAMGRETAGEQRASWSSCPIPS